MRRTKWGAELQSCILGIGLVSLSPAVGCSDRVVSEAEHATVARLAGGCAAAPWVEGASYRVGAKARHGGRTYECVQAHTSLPGWSPDAVPALWRETSGKCDDDGEDGPKPEPDAGSGTTGGGTTSGTSAGGTTSGTSAGGTTSGTTAGGTGPTTGGAPVEPPSGTRIVGYFTAWSIYARSYFVSNVPASKLTHINYAFANISDAGECMLGDSWADVEKPMSGESWDAPLKGNFHALEVLKAAHPGLRTLISVGGWTWSGRFSGVASTEASRVKFARSCVAFMKRYGFDGIDIDWEYPGGGGLEGNPSSPDDRHNYTLLLQELRRQLDALGDGHHPLTIAAPAGPAKYAHLEMPELGRVLDWINVMTYDFHGGWDATTGHNAPLFPAAGDTTRFNTSEAIDAYLKGGVPASKVVMGVPFYGRGWGGVGATNDGLGQRASGAAPFGTWENGVFDYKDLVARYVGKNGYVRHWDAVARVPFLYNPASGVFITYDDGPSMAEKAAFARSRQLGGAMFWDLSSDDGTLLDTLQRTLR